MPRSCPLTPGAPATRSSGRSSQRDRIANNVATPFDQSIVDEAALNDRGVRRIHREDRPTRWRTSARLYGGIRYLRYLDGEKHLVFLTPNGLFLPRLENSNSIAALANDARVSIDIIHTYGMAGGSCAARPLAPQRQPRPPRRLR